ncbi:hypothetical protein [Comamonas kerstersii]|uniref:hypothetical protein n=1 Tax=Comamonas kerstersii TaxID=225992 RepID=UPI001B32B305|nr:hypothetical protein [Comamonas kerstersii]QTW18701.1 hypothetical protein H8N02_16355 [Comamonas kerstersii]
MSRTKGQQTANQRARRQLRFSLLKEILRCESVRTLPSDHKKLLFRLLSNGWSITDTPPDTSRIRALEKVASDARRLRGALNSLEAKDAASLDSNYRQTIPLSTRLLALEELEHDAAALAKVIKGEKAEITRLRQKRTAAQLVKTLCMFGIPCSTRNDHDVDVRNVTTAMRCVMFSMLEAGSKKLGWSTTASIIKLGIRVQIDPSENRMLPLEGLQAVTQAGEDALRLFMLEEPLWSGVRLET